MKSTTPVFWDITLGSPLKLNILPPYSGSNNKPIKNQKSACHLLSRWFLLGSYFDPEDGGDMSLRNVG
jgi:hypothetical protein